MGQDISGLLKDWPYDPHELNVRVVVGDDGQSKIQLRVELGILQMERDGRPDGERPYDSESLLDFLAANAEELGDEFELSPDDLEGLYREGLMYYRRYLAFFHLDWYDLLVRDTDRNLRLLDFVRSHAKRKKDKWRLDQFRPYLLMMNARGRALSLVEKGRREEAIEAVQEGCRRIERFLADYDRSPDDTECRELDMLKRLQVEIGAESIVSKPRSTRRMLEERLREAVAREDYEQAAHFRDRLRKLPVDQDDNADENASAGDTSI
jgi:hypothetical protein